MPYRTCYYQRDFNGITLEKKHPCTGIGSRFSSCSALDNSTRFLMAIEVEKKRSFQQFRTLQGPLLAHQFGEVRMQRPNLVYPRHQAVQVLLAPRTPAATLGGIRGLLCFRGLVIAWEEITAKVLRDTKEFVPLQQSLRTMTVSKNDRHLPLIGACSF